MDAPSSPFIERIQNPDEHFLQSLPLLPCVINIQYINNIHSELCVLKSQTHCDFDFKNHFPFPLIWLLANFLNNSSTSYSIRFVIVLTKSYGMWPWFNKSYTVDLYRVVPGKLPKFPWDIIFSFPAAILMMHHALLPSFPIYLLHFTFLSFCQGYSQYHA
jgi:hypothetical protein